MKRKLLSLIMAVVLSIMVLSVMSFGAFEGYALRFNNQDTLDNFTLTHTNLTLKDGYTTFTSTTHDPNVIYTFEEGELDADKYSFAVIKYRTSHTQDGLIGEMFFESEASGIAYPATHVNYGLNTDGNWNLVVVDFSGKDAWVGDIKALRIDYLEASPLPADASIDIEYIAFFETKEQAATFDGNLDADNPPTFDSSVIFATVLVATLGVVILKKKTAFN